MGDLSILERKNHLPSSKRIHTFREEEGELRNFDQEEEITERGGGEISLIISLYRDSQ